MSNNRVFPPVNEESRKYYMAVRDFIIKQKMTEPAAVDAALEAVREDIRTNNLTTAADKMSAVFLENVGQDKQYDLENQLERYVKDTKTGIDKYYKAPHN